MRNEHTLGGVLSKDYKRRIIVIDPKFQVKLSFIVAMIVFISALIYPFTFIELIDLFIKKYNLPANMVTDLRNQLILLLVVIQIIISFISFCAFLFISHRIAGPVYKMLVTLKKLNNKEDVELITLRKGDNFKDLANEINTLIKNTK